MILTRAQMQRTAIGDKGFMFKGFFNDRVMLAPDGGAGADGGSFDPSVVTAPPRTASKYETQLPREYQQDDFAGIEDLGKLYGAYKELKGREASFKDSVRIPTKDSTADEIGAFYKRLGRPDTEDGYVLGDYDNTPDSVADSKKAFMKEAFRNGLSQNQASNLWKNQLASKAADEHKAAELKKKLADDYPSRIDAFMRDQYPDDTKRKARIEKEENLYKDFIAKTGVGTLLQDSGLSVSPEFVHAVSSWYEGYATEQAGGQRPANCAKYEGMESFYSSMPE